MDINKAGIDIIFGSIGIALLTTISILLLFMGRAARMISLKVFACFSLISSVCLFALLCTGNTREFTSTYFLVQSFSYLIEMAMCIELAEMIIKNNWVVLLIFGPLLSAIMLVFIVKYSIPSTVNDILYPGYAATALCGFILFIIWVLEGKFEGKLEKPYSKIAAIIGIYISFRFLIMLTDGFYRHTHWNIIGRLYPINELLFVALLFYAMLPPSNLIEFPVKMTIKDLAAVCRECGQEYPNHRNGCKHKVRIVSIRSFGRKNH